MPKEKPELSDIAEAINGICEIMDRYNKGVNDHLIQAGTGKA